MRPGKGLINAGRKSYFYWNRNRNCFLPRYHNKDRLKNISNDKSYSPYIKNIKNKSIDEGFSVYIKK